ncbi:hypothetical protein HF638_21235 [Paenibacillus sp. SZ31]|uniref:hypothetical protein n=1 Tax=Paenibacillus sp. SZ31 TaxID=2725555 RepID=UPI00146F8A9D|nr:hypothetical protein [Paenibacillus sp. SZ31]NMI06512.1 hypothetical protein [Paenibacillus sp. SZ31]
MQTTSRNGHGIIKRKNDLPKDAQSSNLTTITGLRLLKNLYWTAEFTESDGKKYSVKGIELTVPSETKYIAMTLGGHDFHFGHDTYIERPFGHIGMYYGIKNWDETTNKVSIEVFSILRDSNGDDPWKAIVDVSLSCYGD